MSTDSEIFLGQVLALFRWSSLAHSTVEEDRQAYELCHAVQDWPRVRKISNGKQGMLPLVARRVLEFYPRQMGDGERELWRDEARVAAVRALEAIALLRNILDTLNQGGVDAICWKGPTQSLRLYGNVGLRCFGDLDIFIRPEQLFQAGEILKSLGFSPERPLSIPAEKLLIKLDSEYPWIKQHAPFSIDLQWKVRAQPILLDVQNNGAWARAQPYQIMDIPTKVWSWPDEVIFLSVHGLKHRWSAWEWISSMARTVSARTPKEWQSLLEISKAQGLERTVYLGLELVRRLVQDTLPTDWSGRVRSDQKVRGLADRFEASIRSELLTGQPLPRFCDWLDYLRISDHPSRTWGDLGKWLLQPSVYDLQLCPRASLMKLSLLRPLRLMRKIIFRSSRKP